MSKDPIVVAAGISKHYGSPAGRVEVLKAANFSAARGDLISIQGVSGSGKSTFLNILGGLMRPDSGTVQIGGHEITRMSNTQLAHLRRKDIGFVFQRFNLLSGMSVLDNVLLPLRLNRIRGTEAMRLATMALHQVNLAHRLEQRASALSVGEMQRAAIARAIVHQPALLLADEPTGNLDVQNKSAILDILTGLGETIVIMVTHDDHVAERCRIRYAMREGTLVAA